MLTAAQKAKAKYDAEVERSANAYQLVQGSNRDDYILALQTFIMDFDRGAEAEACPDPGRLPALPPRPRRPATRPCNGAGHPPAVRAGQDHQAMAHPAVLCQPHAPHPHRADTSQRGQEDPLQVQRRRHGQRHSRPQVATQHHAAPLLHHRSHHPGQESRRAPRRRPHGRRGVPPVRR
eukprot:1683860-Rhodomonas_salina.1